MLLLPVYRFLQRCTCYGHQFASYSMLGKVVLQTVNDYEKSHRVLINGRSSY